MSVPSTLPVRVRSVRNGRDLTGLVFGRLTAVEAGGGGWYRCQCLCGNEKLVQSSDLSLGRTASCGCLKRETARLNAVVKHNMIASPEYGAWTNLKKRCLNPNNKNFRHYGGRGISVCAEWLSSFEKFFAHVGLKPSPSHSIDRIDNNGNYEPGNVRWATKAEQTANRRPFKGTGGGRRSKRLVG